jgi:hypothetical protein
MIVSLVALVVAMSGTAVAGVRLVNGDRLIRKGSLSGNRLRKHTITGRQINMRKLGVVPKARTAVSAGSASLAGHANTSVYAVKSQEAVNADALGGQSPSSFLTTGARVGTNGVVKESGTASGATLTLFSHGPFTVTMTCTTSGNLTSMSVDATSSESNSVIDGAAGLTSDSLGGFNFAQGPQVNGGTYTFEAPSGAGLIVAGSFGTNSDGVSNGCWANFAGIA